MPPFPGSERTWLLKGGYAMELRIQAARTTRDIDLAIRQLPGGARQWDDAAIRSLWENAAGFDLEDSFEFIIGELTRDLGAAPYGGACYPVEAWMAGRQFAKFHVDVSAGDVLREPYEILECRDWLSFAGLPKANIPAVSREEQFAEKLDAYTLPRQGRPNTRVKDSCGQHVDTRRWQPGRAAVWILQQCLFPIIIPFLDREEVFPARIRHICW